MTKISRTAFLWPRPEPKSAIQHRKWVGLLAMVAALTLCGARAEAQQTGKVHRIGVLTGASTAVAAPWIDAFRQGLRESGYIEGKNIILEIRGGEAQPDRLAHLASELTGLKVDIIVAGGSYATDIVKKATNTIPVVMRYDADPVRRGVISGLARPGGNITGLASLTTGLIGKRLELLSEIVSGAKRIAVLAARTDQTNYMATRAYKELEAAARQLGVKLQVAWAPDPATIDNAFLAITKERAQALFVISSVAYVQHRKRIIEHAAKNRLPAMYFEPIFVENGGLMSYGPDFADEFRRLAVYVDKILKGAKPADLPVEQPTKFELVVNLKTAKQIGLTIPPNVLARADRVIR